MPAVAARRARLPFVGQQGQQLDGLAESHVIGQDQADAEPAEKRHPGQASFLIRPQRAAERRRSGDRREPPVGLAGEQVAKPAVRLHRHDRQVIFAAQPRQQRVARRHRARETAFQEPQRRLQVPVIQLDPLTADPDERDLEPGELREFLRVQCLIADRQVVAEVDEVAQAELGLGDGTLLTASGPGGELEPKPRFPRPVGQQDAESGAGQQRRGLAEEAERAGGVQRDLLRGRGSQLRIQLGEQPRRSAEAGQQFFLRMPDAARRLPAGRAGPDIGRRPDQAGVVGGLQGELDPPDRVPRLACGRVLALARVFRMAFAFRLAASSGCPRRPAGPRRPCPRRRRPAPSGRPAPSWSTASPGSWPVSSGSASRKQVRTGPAGTWAAARQAASSALRSAASAS